MKVVVLDFETTGLSAAHNRIIEVGAVALDGKDCVGTFSQLVHPGDFLPYNITQITGITDEMLNDQPPAEVVMPKLAEFISDRTIIAHNASFDAKFLNSEMKRVDIELSNPVLCTLRLARRVLPGFSSYSLGNLAHHLGISLTRAHRALDDAKATAYLWRYIFEELSSQIKDEIDLNFLQKFSEISKKQVQKRWGETSSPHKSSF
ncbi:MAG: 3'-5' exonuclease [Bdellovibrionaceae bacterium]|nr:3'-5' exonuclease [Pseudobdellovibrionaceae bacterium]